MKNRLGRAAIIAAIALVPAAAAAGELQLSIANGRVTLVAQDVTVKQILDEWARVGQTTIVNAEKLTSASISLELNDVAEGRALESLLRSASGYIATPRTATAGASGYDRILIMPTSRPPAVSPTPQPFANRAPSRRSPVPPPVDDEMEANPNPILPPGAVPAQPQQFPGQPPMQPGVQPGMQPPMTAPRPGQLPMPNPAVPGYPGDAAGPAGAPAERPGVELQRVPPAARAARRPRRSGGPAAPADLADLAAARSSDVHSILHRFDRRRPRPAGVTLVARSFSSASNSVNSRDRPRRRSRSALLESLPS